MDEMLNSENNPFGLLDMVSDAIGRDIMQIPLELLSMDEPELKRFVRPTETDDMLRASFWVQFNRALASGSNKISIDDVYLGICSVGHFTRRVLKNPKRLAWIICPQKSYQKSMETLLTKCAARWHELVNMDIHSTKLRVDPDTGKSEKVVDPNKARILVDVLRYIEDRVQGSPVQRKITKHEISPKAADQLLPAEFEDVKSLDDKIKYLEGSLKPDVNDEIKSIIDAET